MHETKIKNRYKSELLKVEILKDTSLLIFSDLAPTLYLFMNLELINEIAISNITLGLLIICLINLQFKDIRKEIVRNYIRLILYQAY